MVGGLIGINESWVRKRIAIKDCNTAVAGAYNVDNNTTDNFPMGAYKYGTLLVVDAGFFGSQFFLPDNYVIDPYMYVRSISANGTNFHKWAKIPITIMT